MKDKMTLGNNSTTTLTRFAVVARYTSGVVAEVIVDAKSARSASMKALAFHKDDNSRVAEKGWKMFHDKKVVILGSPEYKTATEDRNGNSKVDWSVDLTEGGH